MKIRQYIDKIITRTFMFKRPITQNTLDALKTHQSIFNTKPVEAIVDRSRELVIITDPILLYSSYGTMYKVYAENPTNPADWYDVTMTSTFGVKKGSTIYKDDPIVYSLSKM